VAPANYAVPDEALTVIENVVWADPAIAPIPPSWILCNPGPGVGWISADNGKTWIPPVATIPADPKAALAAALTVIPAPTAVNATTGLASVITALKNYAASP
jgi:hypothetical protein